MKLRKIDKRAYTLNPSRYELRNGSAECAPSCPYGNAYRWVGYDTQRGEFVRFVKSVFKQLVNQRLPK